MPRKTGFSVVHILAVNPPGEGRYRLDIWTQPLHHWIIAAIYHRYDMIVFRLPGFEPLERWKAHRAREVETYLPISAKQDLRCYRLTEKERTTLAKFEISKELAGQIMRL